MIKKSRFTTLAGIGAISLLLLTGCSAASDANTNSEEDAAAQVEKVPGIGDTVTDGDIEFVVNSVTCSTDPMQDETYAALPPTGQFCKVNVSATATKDIGMFLGNISITTAQLSDEVSPAVGAMMYEGTLRPDYIDNGQTLTGDVVFDIAVDDSVATVLLKKNAMSDGVVVTVE